MVIETQTQPSASMERYEQLRTAVRGMVLQPGDPGYDAATAVYNGMIHRHPAVIVRAMDVADVMAAVNLARERKMLLAIRGGGHHGAGLGTCDDGLVIDLSLMKGIRVDPEARTASRATANASPAMSRTRCSRFWSTWPWKRRICTGVTPLRPCCGPTNRGRTPGTACGRR